MKMRESQKQSINKQNRELRADIKRMDSRADAAESKGLVRQDGWNNLFTGLGTPNDKRMQTTFKVPHRLGWRDMENLYIGDGLARRVIDLVTKEMTRKGFEVEGDTSGIVIKAMRKNNLYTSIREMVRWSRLFGGVLGVMEINDGSASMINPVREGRIQSINGIHVYNRWRTWWTPADLYQDPKNPKYMTPQFYTVSPILSTPFRVHETRCLRMDGFPVTDTYRIRNLGWGDSVLQAYYDKLRSFFEVYANVESIIEDFVTGAMSIKNLGNLLETDEGAASVKKRLEILDMSRHILNTMLLDADMEQFEKHASSVAGLSDLMDRYGQQVCLVEGIPATLLFGRSPAGMNATGESDFQSFYDNLSANQEQDMTPVMERVVYLLSLCKVDGFNRASFGDIKWKQLLQLSEMDEAKRRFIVSQTALNWARAGLTSGEIITSTFGGNHFSIEIKLDPTIKPEDRILSLPMAKGGSAEPIEPGDEPKTPEPGEQK